MTAAKFSISHLGMVAYDMTGCENDIVWFYEYFASVNISLISERIPISAGENEKKKKKRHTKINY